MKFSFPLACPLPLCSPTCPGHLATVSRRRTFPRRAAPTSCAYETSGESAAAPIGSPVASPVARSHSAAKTHVAATETDSAKKSMLRPRCIIRRLSSRLSSRLPAPAGMTRKALPTHVVGAKPPTAGRAGERGNERSESPIERVGQPASQQVSGPASDPASDLASDPCAGTSLQQQPMCATYTTLSKV